jgi:hypothetical protein
MTACPFTLCSASVTMVAERAAPGPDPQAVRRVPQHQLGGHEELGLCPASLLLVPLSDYDAEQLATQAAAIGRLLALRAPVDEPRPDRSRRDPGTGTAPGRVPRPDNDPRWFRGSPGGRTTGPVGHQGYDQLPQVLLPPTGPERAPLRVLGPEPAAPSTTSTSGGSAGMSSVQEVREAISAAGEVCAQVSQGLFALESEAGTALAALDSIRETSVDPMGVPQIRSAIEKIGEANALLRQAIEIGVNYKASL